MKKGEGCRSPPESYRTSAYLMPEQRRALTCTRVDVLRDGTHSEPGLEVVHVADVRLVRRLRGPFRRGLVSPKRLTHPRR